MIQPTRSHSSDAPRARPGYQLADNEAMRERDSLCIDEGERLVQIGCPHTTGLKIMFGGFVADESFHCAVD